MTNIVYKIRNAEGLFSTGGSYPHFNERGKTWQQRGHLSNHLAQLGKHGQSEYIKQGCAVVTYELVQTETDIVGIRDYIAGVSERRKVREEEQKKRVADYHRQRDLEQLARLKSIYEGKPDETV